VVSTDGKYKDLDDTAIVRSLNVGGDDCLNRDVEEIKDNIRTNIKRGLPQLKRYEDQPDNVITIVGGGPSLNDPESLADLRECAAKGYPIVAVNGSNKWLDDNGIKYHCHVMLDSREWNKRFVENPKKGVKYFIASQCDPAVFDILEGFDTYIWHGGTVKFVKEDMEKVYGSRYIRVKTGRTVVLAALYVFRMLGFKKYEIFGFDSCNMGDSDTHHAYEQKENNFTSVAEFEINGRTFRAHPWMIGQAQDWFKFTKIIGHKFDVNIHGDGLIAWIISSIADTGKFEYDQMDGFEEVVAAFAVEQQKQLLRG
jgi:hypothetical protein